MSYSVETGKEGSGGLKYRGPDPTAVESHWSSLLYRCVPMEECTGLGSKLSRKLSGHPSSSTLGLGWGW